VGEAGDRRQNPTILMRRQPVSAAGAVLLRRA
jgi:hypothetical protein